ncbi:MAG: AlpA family transcriptional regulator [Pseudobdellovibrionaceae bacterium]|nr:AlpA family transcriptional regulator [Pseudobdellovibrionaceae bacterium]
MFEDAPKERILRLPDVKKRTGLSRSTIYLNISKGTFPRHISLGVRCVGWLESEIDAWVQARINQRSIST